MPLPYVRYSRHFLDRARSALVPIFGSHRRSIHLLGSSVVIDTSFGILLLTAEHIGNQFERCSLLIPGINSEIDLIGCLVNAHFPNSVKVGKSHNFAYFNLDETVLRQMRPYEFSTLKSQEIDLEDETHEGDNYSIIGFPRTPGEIEPQLGYPDVEVLACEGVSKPLYERMHLSSEDHIILRFPQKKAHEKRTWFNSPVTWPHSLSGGGVFAWGKQIRRIEDLAAPKLVAIVTEYHPKDKIFTAVRLHQYFAHIAGNSRFGIF